MSEIKSTYHRKVKQYDIAFHAHELTFSCYHRTDYLNDTEVCVLLEDWPWSSAWARQTGVGPILDMFCVPFLTK